MSDPNRDLSDALAVHKAGRFDDAERLYRDILARMPQNADALHLLGILRAQRGDAAAGVDLIGQAITVRPDVPMFHNNLGRALAETGDQPGAVASYRRAADLEPRYVEAHFNLGLALAALDDLAGAEAAYRRALELAPDDARARNNLGVVLQACGRGDEAELCFQAVLTAHPGDVETLANLAGLMRVRGQTVAAKAHYRRALEQRPDLAKAWAGLGSTCLAEGDLDGAAAALDRAAELVPNDDFMLMNRASVLMTLDDFPAAQACYRRLLAAPAPSLLAQRNRILAALYDPSMDGELRAAAHLEFGRAMAARVEHKLPAPVNDPAPERRLRIGWLSSDFRDHPVARNVQPFFAHRDRAQSEMICYAEDGGVDTTANWFRGEADLWRPTTGLSDAAVARQIRADAIDVMIYVAGRFDRNRPQIALWRPAPVQVSLFDAATSGLAEMDYFIADSVMVPARPTERFVERVLRLPNFYAHAPLDEAPPVAPPPMAAAGYVTFGCLNNPAKINRAVLDLWAEILRSVPDSRLVLKFRNYYASVALRQRVSAALAAGGIAPTRVLLHDAIDDITPHLDRYRQIDIALDPFPFTGSTTTFEALWMGVPVISLLGSNFMARWSASMLHHVDLGDLVASSRAAYRDIAIGLAADREGLAALRVNLRPRIAASVLCDGARTTRYIERALRAVWRKWCRERTG